MPTDKGVEVVLDRLKGVFDTDQPHNGKSKHFTPDELKKLHEQEAVLMEKKEELQNVRLKYVPI